MAGSPHSLSHRRVVFRADGGTKIGLGHVMRCLALAGVLQEHFPLAFAIREPEEKILDIIRPFCQEIISLETFENREEEARSLAARLSRDDILVTDGYEFLESYQQILLADSERKLVAIDDLHQVHMHAHAVINHNGGIAAEAYSTEPYTRLYIGPEYALLRPPFLAPPAVGFPEPETGTYFICMGGSDPFNLTKKLLDILLSFSDTKRCEVVAGGANPHLEALKQIAKNSPGRVRLHHNLDAHGMYAVMRSVQNGICPGSSVALEACAAGMRLFTGHYVDNQFLLAGYLGERGLSYPLGDLRELSTWQLKQALKEAPDRATMMETQSEVFGGKQKENLFAIFEAWK